MKKPSDFHNFYVQSDTLLLADIFENFVFWKLYIWNRCIEVFELDISHFLSALGLAWQTCLKKTEVELELLTSIGMLLMV